MAGGDDPFFLKFWVNGALVNGPRWSEIADFQPIFALIGSPLRAFQ